MDITIPPHNLKRFTSSITCLGKIGKDLYLSFDPLDGLTLSSLNDAKSAFGKFHFEPGFFERCSAPPVVGRGDGARGGRRRDDGAFSGHGGSERGDDDDTGGSDEEFDDTTRYVCRVPVRSVHSILRPRKGVCSLRIRSEGMDDQGNLFGLKRKKKKKKKRMRRRGDDSDGGGEERRGRGSFSARERRSRKRRKRQKSKSRSDAAESNGSDGEELASSIPQNTDKMMLSFEFFIERPAPENAIDPTCTAIPNGGVFRALHKVGVDDAHGITHAYPNRGNAQSEVVTPPKLWLRLLDPLRGAAEVAVTLDDELKVVTATSFHPGEIGDGNGGDGHANAVLRAAAERDAQLKTETSMGVDEFTEYDFRNNRGKERGRRGDGGESEESENGRSKDEFDFEEESEKPPLDVNQKVILVFSIKEAKAMLQFCAQTTSYDDDGVIFSFHWGGKPIVVETDGEYFSAELVLATLHHGMIASNITVCPGGSGDRD